MVGKKSEYLELPLSSERDMLESDCLRIVGTFREVDACAETADEQLDGMEGRAGSLEIHASALETTQVSMKGILQDHAAFLSSLATEKADATALAGEVQARTETVSDEASTRIDAITAAITVETQAREEAVTAHGASLSAHDALMKRVTVGNLSPVIGICCVEDGGGSGLWFNIDAEGQPVSPPRSYFDYYPTYNTLHCVLVDGQMMQEHHKFYYKAFEIVSGPFANRRGRCISPGQMDGSKPLPSFIENGREVDAWYYGTLQAADEGGSPERLGSQPGKAPFINVDFPTIQSYCRNRNVGSVDGFDMWNIYQAAEIQLLVLIEAATPDSQAYYGRRRADTSPAVNVGTTDVATAPWRGHVGLWGSVWQMYVGLEISTSGTVELWKNDGNKEWVNTGSVCLTYDGSNLAYMQTLRMGNGEGFNFEDMFFPATTTTSVAAGTIPDGFWDRNGSAGNVCYLSADWSVGVRADLFAYYLANPAFYANTTIGCRLAKM